MKVVIIGGGIIGLSIGWQLAKAKLDVHIFEKRSVGKQASWAAAGMLSPFWEGKPKEEAWLKMAVESFNLYPSFLKELGQDIGIKIPPEKSGTLCVAYDRDDREWLKQVYECKKKGGLPVQWLTKEEVMQKEPLISPKVYAGVWVEKETQVNNRSLLEHLKTAFLSFGGKISENKEITEVKGVTINTSGAWAAQFSGNSVRPLKGQILTLKMPPDLTLQSMIRSRRIYMAPKLDGSLRIGATEEDVGFNETVTAGAIHDLLKNAWEIVPAISEFTFEEAYAALRPISLDRMPHIGRTDIKGFYQAVGHGRSGILLTPYTAYTLKNIILQDLNAS